MPVCICSSANYIILTIGLHPQLESVIIALQIIKCSVCIRAYGSAFTECDYQNNLLKCSHFE